RATVQAALRARLGQAEGVPAAAADLAGHVVRSLKFAGLPCWATVAIGCLLAGLVVLAVAWAALAGAGTDGSAAPDGGAEQGQCGAGQVLFAVPGHGGGGLSSAHRPRLASSYPGHPSTWRSPFAGVAGGCFFHPDPGVGPRDG